MGDSSIIIYDQLETYNKDKLNFAMGMAEDAEDEESG